MSDCRRRTFSGRDGKQEMLVVRRESVLCALARGTREVETRRDRDACIEWGSEGDSPLEMNGGGEEEKRRKDNTSGTLSLSGLRALTFHVSAAVESVDSFASLENCVNCRLPSTLLPANYENEEEGKGDVACLRRGGKMRRMCSDSLQASYPLPYSQTTHSHFMVR